MKRLDQQGMVSIIVSSVIVTILALIVLSFASIMRNAQQQALDKQLNAQAFYAAETAVNDVRQQLFAGTLNENIDTCDNAKSGSQQVTSDKVNANSSITSEIGCVTVNVRPQKLTYDSVSLDRSKVASINPVDSSGNPVTLNTLSIVFSDPDGQTSYATKNLPPYSSWGNGPGMLRIEVIAVPSGSIDRTALRDNNRVYFVNTGSSGSAPIGVDWSTTTVQSIANGCNSASNQCGIRITGLPVSGVRNYIVRLRSYYKPVSVEVTGTSSSGTVNFGNAQAIVDATGRSNDVVYRTREVIPLNPDYDYPEYGVQAGDLCKRIAADTTTVSVENTGNSVNNPACSL